MTSTNKTLAQTLLNFSKNYSQQYIDQVGHLPIVEHDDQWLSPCEVGHHHDNYYYWQPFAIQNKILADSEEQLCFANIEGALEIELHQDIKTYFTTIFSGDIEAQCLEGELSLLFAWNKEDFARLQENIIGHVLMKKKLKQPVTIFFAVTDEEDMIVSLDNSNGEVWVERVGCKPHKKLSDSLVHFISQLTPNIITTKE